MRGVATWPRVPDDPAARLQAVAARLEERRRRDEEIARLLAESVRDERDDRRALAYVVGLCLVVVIGTVVAVVLGV
jgi:hypothetical protein